MYIISALHLEGILDVHQKTFLIMQHKTTTDGEIESCISEQARIDYDDDIVAMYNMRIIKHTQHHLKIGSNGIIQKAKPSLAYFSILAFIFIKK